MKQITFQLETFSLWCWFFNPPIELFYHQLINAAPHPGSPLGLEADPAKRIQVMWKENICHTVMGGEIALGLCWLKDLPTPR